MVRKTVDDVARAWREDVVDDVRRSLIKRRFEQVNAQVRPALAASMATELVGVSL
jgi:hypothetical protein